LLKQVLHYSLRSFTEAAVNWRDLNDGAAGSDEPMEALALRQECDRCGIRIAVAYFDKCAEMPMGEFDIGFGPERAEANLVQVHAGAEETLLPAKQDDAGVDEFLTFHAGHNAEDGVVK
jgi:hypothetical protein